ncbi:hypothetical protein [Amycolatopsis sp. cmx-11-32]|uniref:hypothetical protein n=1 Tax=Amycolatopsis sp. cmx-11-32 TaxID=2785796 RepID=UPI0039E5DAB8
MIAPTVRAGQREQDDQLTDSCDPDIEFSRDLRYEAGDGEPSVSAAKMSVPLGTAA